MKEKWLKIGILILLTFACWKLNAIAKDISIIAENTAEIRDGIEVEIVDAIDVPSITIPIPSVSI